MIIPESSGLVGREEELHAIHSSNVPIVHLWGLPGVGRSSLIAWYIKHYRGRDQYTGTSPPHQIRLRHSS